MTLRQLARSLGLSITTVSRALDGYGDVAPATRERVRQAADDMRYRPNAAARRLRRGSTEVVTLVLPTGPGRFDEPLYLELMATMGERFADAGYDLTVLAAPPGADEMKLYRRIVEGRRADGLVVVRARRQDARIAYLQGAQLPFVVMGRSDTPGIFPFVDGDGRRAFDDATRDLLVRGHRRVAHLAAPAAFTYAGFRRAGYEDAMAEAGLPPLVVECPADETEAARAAAALLARPDRPTAILCATDRMAFGVVKAARQAGLSVPADLSVVGHDNVPAAAYADPPLSTMELPLGETGRRLADMLLARIGGTPPDGMQAILPVRAVPRGSVASPP